MATPPSRRARLAGWTRKALVFGERRDVPRPRHLPALLLSLGIMLVVSFVMLWIGDKINAQGAVLTRFMARGQAPLTAQWFYPGEQRDRITVVMYDDQFLATTNSAWPISYEAHADNLLRLANEHAQRPKAIFLDITFGQARQDPTVPYLAAVLCQLHKAGIGVYLAALADDKGRLRVREGLNGLTDMDGQSCFTLVGVDYVPDPLDGIAWTYELSRHQTFNGWARGPTSPEARAPAYRSAAMAMAEQSGGVSLAEETAPMALIWGHNSATQEMRPAQLGNCQPGERRWTNVVPRVVRQLWEPAIQPPLCPYHRTLSISQLDVMTQEQLNYDLKDKFVFVGAHVPGYNDFANSPVHGLLPGVHAHAMALDNFLTYGKDYKRQANWDMPPDLHLFTTGIAVIAVVFIVHVLWRRAPRCVRVLARCGRGRPWIGRARDTVRQWRSIYRSWSPRTRHLLGKLRSLLGWLLRLTLQTIAAMMMIGWLQKTSQIGLLPVVELIGMALLAEALGVMQLLDDLLFGLPEEPRTACAPPVARDSTTPPHTGRGNT